MKKLFFTLVLVLVTLTSSAQSKKAQKSARNNTDKMTAELSLNEEDSAKVYDIFLAKFTQGLEVKETYKDDPKTKKQKMTALGKETQSKLKAVVGEENFQKWVAYMKANNKKKKK